MPAATVTTPATASGEITGQTAGLAASRISTTNPPPSSAPVLTTAASSPAKPPPVADVPTSADRPVLPTTTDSAREAPQTDTGSLWKNLTSPGDRHIAPTNEATAERTVPIDDPTRLVERLSQHIQDARETGRQLTVRITPPDLGPMRIDVSSMADGVRARLETTSVTAERILQQGLPQLHDTLTQMGVPIDRIEVVRITLDIPTAGDPAAGGSSGQFGASPQSQQDAADRNSQRTLPPEPPPALRPSPVSETPRTTVSGPLQIQELNVRV